MRPDDVIAQCRTSHRTLVAALASLSDSDFRSPSLLPGYTRAHVVAHLTNKAKAHVWLFGGPAAREVRRLHPEGYDPDHAAAAGASRSPSELRSGLERSFVELEAAWETLDEGMWDWQGVMMVGPRTMAEIVGHHLRNVEVHHVDLAIGHRPSDWPALFVEGELPKRLQRLRDRADDADLLAWLLGRGQPPDLGPW